MFRIESPRSKLKLIRFLKEHFRYFTGHSWNRSTSYARVVKIHRLGLDDETERKCYEMLDIPEAFCGFSQILSDFAAHHGYKWQISQNGRSGGYLVLCQGGRENLGYKSQCSMCLIPTWYEARQHCHVKECEGTLEPIAKPVWKTYVYFGRGIDEDGDFESWCYEDLRRRVALVKDFDRACGLAVEAFVNFAKSHKVTEEEIVIPRKIKVAVEA